MSLGLDRTNTVIWTGSWEGSHYLQRAVSRKRALPRVDNSERKESLILSRASVVESPPDAKPLARYKQWHYSDLLYRQLPLKRQFFIHLHKYKEHNKHYLLNVNL